MSKWTTHILLSVSSLSSLSSPVAILRKLPVDGRSLNVLSNSAAKAVSEVTFLLSLASGAVARVTGFNVIMAMLTGNTAANNGST
ncbi:hypothetical protein D3C86_1572630 [compost metagenome]